MLSEGKIKINLGCGKDYREGYIGVDRIKFGNNEVCDLEKDSLPFETNSVDEIYSQHFLEHLRDPRNCLNECHRVLRSGGIMESVVPYGLWDGASKPVHHQSITACWFDFLKREDNFERYEYKPWKLIELIERRGKKGEIFEIYCKMTPHGK